jgi:hypothetical protein
MEALIVFAIIGILLAVAIPAFRDRGARPAIKKEMDALITNIQNGNNPCGPAYRSKLADVPGVFKCEAPGVTAENLNDLPIKMHYYYDWMQEGETISPAGDPRLTLSREPRIEMIWEPTP